MLSYAQNFEDVLLRRALGAVKKGTYLDIGAQDPVIDSVSLSFYDAGWRGIHVEATPTYAARLRQGRPDEVVIEAAASNEAGPIRFYEIENTGLSTGSKQLAEHHVEDGYGYREIVVPCIRLDQLFDLFGDDLHWMKIDVEGMEADVLRSWRDHPQRPWILVIEATSPNTQNRTDQLWLDEVVKRGYQSVFFDGLSSYFVHDDHKELSAAFTAPANVFDGFSVPANHFSAVMIRREFEAAEQRYREEAASLEQRFQEEAASAEQLRGQVHEAWEAYDGARSEQRSTLERLIQAEEDHRRAIEATALAREASEGAHREREEQLRREVADAQEERNVARIELARLEERSAQLAERLDSAEARRRAAEEQLAQVRADFEEARIAAAEAVAQVSAEASQQAKRLARERDEARQHTTQVSHEMATLRSEHEADRQAAESEAAKLQSAIDQLASKLDYAQSLITNAASEAPGTWQRLGEALRLARPSTARAAVASWNSHTQGPDDANWSTVRLGDPPPVNGARNPFLRANSLPELLSWDDVQFVRCAYVTILGRQPDRVGEAYYTRRLRDGGSKLEILWQLRRSKEGLKHDPGLVGLDRALKRARLQRAKVIGPLFRSIWPAIDSGASGERRFRAVMNALQLNQALTRGLSAEAVGSSERSTPQPDAQPSPDGSPSHEAMSRVFPLSVNGQAAPELEHLCAQSPVISYFSRQLAS